MSERAILGLALVAVVLASFLAGPQPSPSVAFLRWARSNYRLGPAAVTCLHDRLDHGLLRGIDPDGTELAHQLSRRGLDAIPIDRRQLVGNVVLACALQPGRPT